MAYGRVNVDGPNGLQIKEIREVKGTIFQNEETKIIDVGEYDIEKTVFTISAYSEYLYQDFSSLLVYPKNNRTVEISHQTISVAGVIVNFTIRMYVFEGIKKIHAISHLLNPRDIATITIANNINTQKCLIFKTFKTNHNTDFTGMSLFQEELYNEGAVGKMKIVASGSSKDTSQYAHIKYQIVELN